MNWLSLSPVEIFAAWAVLGAAALWLYLHHRRPQRRTVSTLRFWASVQAVSQPRRKKVREPWALIAQILFLLLILLALANPRLGITTAGRSVVMILDTSIWSQAHPSGESAWIDQERSDAIRLIDALPSSDRVLLLRSEGDAAPILPFTSDHAELRRAISNAQASGSAGDIPRALQIARAAVAGSGRSLLVYVGPGMLSDEQSRSLDQFRASIEAQGQNQSGDQPQFLVRLAGEKTIDNRGITRLSLRRDAAQPNRWHLLTQLKNYSDSKASVILQLSVNGESLGAHAIALTPNELANTENEFVWDKGGYLQAQIGPPDALSADDRAVVSLPTFRTIHVALNVGGNPEFATNLLNVLSSNPYVDTQMVVPGMPLQIPPDVAIYQGTSLPAEPAYNSIFFLAGPASSASHSVRVTQWNSQHPVTRWVRTRDVSVRNPAALTALPTDTVLAYTDENPPAPLILAREQNGHRLLIVGFDPHNSNFPMESAFPLLMAGGMEWMTHSVDEAAESVSTGELNLPGPVTRIVGPSGRDVPFAHSGSDVHLLALETGMYRIITPSGESSIAINTPLLPAQRLIPTAAEVAGVESEARQVIGSDLWRWPVLFAIVVLWLEWWLYYSARERQRTVELPETPGDVSLQYLDGELEEREDPGSTKPNFVAR
jgi:hypothetical protein